jgi:glycosyltransferase involved in cell wall biosynthesis
VISEANSCGLPVLTSDVGGIATAITNRVNGAAFSLENFVERAAGFVLDFMSDRAKYHQLALSSFKESENKLNWRVAGTKVREYLEEICR